MIHLLKSLPNSFSARLIIITFLSGFLPVIIFTVLMNVFANHFSAETNLAVQQGQYNQWQRSKVILDQMTEGFVRQKAMDVALQVELFLDAHPDMTVKELQKDDKFRELAIQPIGKTGHTIIQEADTAINRFHFTPQMENRDFHQFSERLPEFWSILNKSLHGKYAHGYYRWETPDGKFRDKFMYIVPVNRKTGDNIRFCVAATTYIDEFTRPVRAAQDVSSGTTELLTLTINRLIQSIRNSGFLFMSISIALILCLALWTGLYFSRTIRYLRDATKSVNKGDFDVQLNPISSGDIGKLVKDFNTMVQHLAVTTVKKEELEKKQQELNTLNKDLQREITDRKQAENALRNHQGQLEALIAERTGELTHSNNQLKTEIEERKQAKNALRLNEQNMKAILRASPVGIGLMINRQFNWANEMMSLLTGYENDMLIGLKTRKLYANKEKYDQIGRELYDRVFQAEIGEVTTQWVRKDGTLFDCKIRAYLLKENDLSQGVIIAVTDISNAKQLEGKLRQAQKMEAIGTLAGGVAHDLNNMLSSIISYPEFILLDLPKASPLQKPLRTILKSGKQMAAVVQDLLTMARRGVAVREIININVIINNQINSPEMHQMQKFHPSVTIHSSLQNDLLNMTGSEPHLTKTFMNLINNGAEAMVDGGNITISTKNIYIDQPIRGYETVTIGDYAAISITDEGTGIAKEELPHIFEPFYTKKKMGRSGSGLGMAVVWGTVKDHNGYIDILSSEGKGTTFTLYFPTTCKPLQQKVETLSLEKFQGSRESILIVDDSTSQREIVKNILGKLNYKVASVPSGEKAVQYLKLHDPHLIILDMIMDPGIDGLETYRQIIAFKPDQAFIIASGYSENKRVQDLQELSGCLYINKPYSIEQIGVAIQKSLKKYGHKK